MNNSDDLFSALSVSKEIFPRILASREEDQLIRYQWLPAPDRYSMLLWHRTHFCGYVLIDSKWEDMFYNGYVGDLLVSYSGRGTREISWRWFNPTKQLRSHAAINRGGRADYWIGFDLQDRPSIPEGDAIDLLKDFEERVHGFTRNHS